MITLYNKRMLDTTLETITEPIPGCWINASDPSEEETVALQEMLGIPHDFVTYPLDLSESPRTEREDGALLIVLRVPHFQGEASDIPFITVPLGIILTERYLATICRAESSVIKELVAGRAKGLSTGKRNRFVLQLMLITANRFLVNLRRINHMVDELEDRLQSSLRNNELLGLLKAQKSLVYFTTALKSNEVMLQHLQRSQLFKQYPDDQDLLEDVLTEIQQAIEMATISSGILTGMMDAYASIISNNVNSVMKLLASVTIVVSLPTMVASFYGMNVNLPMQESPWAFVLILIIAIGLALVVLVAMWRKDLL